MSNPGAMITVSTSDNEEFQLRRALAMRSVTIANILADVEDIENLVIPLPNVSSDSMRKVVEFLEHYENDVEAADAEQRAEDDAPSVAAVPLGGAASADSAGSAEPAEHEQQQEHQEQEQEHSKPSNNNHFGDRRVQITPWDREFCQVENTTLFDMIAAANYLDIKHMLDVTCDKVAEMIRGKTPEEIRVLFDIQNDFTPEEEEAVRKENEWCESV